MSQTIKLKEVKFVEFIFEVTNMNIDVILMTCMVTLCYIFILTVACRAVAMQRPRVGRYTGPFVGIGSVNTFPLLGSRCLLDYNNGNRLFLRGVCRDIVSKGQSQLIINPCGGGVEYLRRDPASRKRRRKGTSQI
jgi:hypothetical protein